MRKFHVGNLISNYERRKIMLVTRIFTVAERSKFSAFTTVELVPFKTVATEKIINYCIFAEIPLTSYLKIPQHKFGKLSRRTDRIESNMS